MEEREIYTCIEEKSRARARAKREKRADHRAVESATEIFAVFYICRVYALGTDFVSSFGSIRRNRNGRFRAASSQRISNEPSRDADLAHTRGHYRRVV